MRVNLTQKMRFKGFTLITIDLVQPVFHVPADTVWRMFMDLYFKKQMEFPSNEKKQTRWLSKWSPE